MNTNDNRLKAHKLIDHIFQDLLPAHGMAQRPEQIQLSHRMLDAMQDGRIALCDAGTGIGKTYAYLAAATAASAFPTGQIARPIIISTSSIALQNAVLTEYLPLLSCVLMTDGILTKPLKAVIRKGKSHYVCDERLDRRLRQVYPAKKNPEALTALWTLRETLDMDRVSHLSGYDRERVCVPQVCDCKQRDCRYQRFLKTCDKNQFLFQICNHNLLVADAIHRSEGKRPIFPEHSIIIVDEAHKLPETAQQMLGVTLAAEEIRNLILQLKEERYLLAAEMLEDSTGPLLRKLAQPREEAEPVEACLRLLTAPSRTLPIIQRQIGSLLENCEYGIYGVMRDAPRSALYPEGLSVGSRSAVHTGAASIIATVEGDEPQEYGVEIVRCFPQSEPSQKGMVLRVTDERLLHRTGGIVQGMSGSPILQDGRIIGAVTHVYLSDATQGYGMYIEWMLEKSDALDAEAQAA